MTNIHKNRYRAR